MLQHATFVQEITVIDPDTKGEVEISIYKHQNGGMFGIDSSFIEQEREDGIIVCPFSDIQEMDIIQLTDD